MMKGVERKIYQQQKENVEEERGLKSLSPTSSTAAAVVVLRPSCGNITIAPLIHKMASVSIAATTTSKKKTPLLQPYRKVEMPKGVRLLRRICKYCGLHLKFWKESEGSFKIFNGIETISVPPNSELVEYFCGGCGDGYVFDKPQGWSKP